MKTQNEIISNASEIIKTAILQSQYKTKSSVTTDDLKTIDVKQVDTSDDFGEKFIAPLQMTPISKQRWTRRSRCLI